MGIRGFFVSARGMCKLLGTSAGSGSKGRKRESTNDSEFLTFHWRRGSPGVAHDQKRRFVYRSSGFRVSAERPTRKTHRWCLDDDGYRKAPRTVALSLSLSCSLAHRSPFSPSPPLRFSGRDGPIRWMDSVLDVVPSSSHGEARPE
ncbi:hypothetical protein GW17_00054104 [Ensete ventricosum]|nr:hypothetical protein GW17_00054104 [Ensete ventricosum]